MWYFAWIPAIGVVLALGVINVMWLEPRRSCEAVHLKTC
ncbi:cytochrome bd-I oxidase subunit CydX [Paraburkholderia rhynchosiae]|nr:cytochrome bd-I oxidase subunit CydX [Paraburkholderia rhynchosiae]PMS31593.1 cytochrome bd-I oxidase subunit CydX [Paraburkholderia rhynchosiae]